jgi:hypothetical protein
VRSFLGGLARPEIGPRNEFEWFFASILGTPS